MQHMGFKGAMRSIMAKEGKTPGAAAAILAAGARDASASAKKKNPRLKRVSGA